MIPGYGGGLDVKSAARRALVALGGMVGGLILAVITASASAGASGITSTDPSSAATVEIVAFGDSLTHGYGLPDGVGFVDQLEEWLNRHSSRDINVINAGESGGTSSGGVARLEWSLAAARGGKPALLILELGANDGLRGIDPAITRRNIDALVATLAEKGIPVLVAGMQAPPNLGPDYAAAFNTIFADIAEKYGAALYPFFLEGVAAVPALNQADGIHPNEEGVSVIVSMMGPFVLRALGFEEEAGEEEKQQGEQEQQ